MSERERERENERTGREGGSVTCSNRERDLETEEYAAHRRAKGD